MKEKFGYFIMIYYLCKRINKRNKPIAVFLDREWTDQKTFFE